MLSLALALFLPASLLAQVATGTGGTGTAPVNVPAVKAPVVKAPVAAPAPAAPVVAPAPAAPVVPAAPPVAGPVVPAAPPAPAIPAAPPAPPLPGAGIVTELQALQTQVGKVNTAVNKVTADVKPVTESFKKLIDIGESYPRQVSEFKSKYGIPEKATPVQELDGVSRALLEKAGLDPKQASVTSKTVAAANERAKAFKPLSAEGIMLSVGITAGMSVLGQLTSTGKVDLKSAMSFVGDKGFWGGLIGSGLTYSLAALAITRFLPPGFGGPVAAFLPAFGAITASFLGGEVGANALRSGSLRDALKNISIAEIIAQGAGSTIGMFVGANLMTSVAAGMGSFAGPLGSIVGGIIGASLGRWAVNTVKNMVSGKPETEMSASDPAADPASSKTVPGLPGAALMPAADIRQIQEDYRAAYVSYIHAEQSGNKAARETQHKKLEAMKKQYELSVRTLMSTMATPGHQPAPR